jgi:hypothetical protein
MTGGGLAHLNLKFGSWRDRVGPTTVLQRRHAKLRPRRCFDGHFQRIANPGRTGKAGPAPSAAPRPVSVPHSLLFRLKFVELGESASTRGCKRSLGAATGQEISETCRDHEGLSPRARLRIQLTRALRVCCGDSCHVTGMNLRILVGATGFEPATPCAQGRIRPCRLVNDRVLFSVFEQLAGRSSRFRSLGSLGYVNLRQWRYAPDALLEQPHVLLISAE